MTQAKSTGASDTAVSESKLGARNWFWIVPVSLSVLGIATVLYFTRFGAWTTGDAVHYIAGARSLVAGDIFGYPAADGVRPIVAFPPFLSTVLAGVGIFGVDPLLGIRYLNSILFGANIAMIWLITFRFSGSKVTAGLIAAWFLLSQIQVTVHGAAMSEALFISLTLVSIYMLGRHVDDDKSYWLVLGGVAAGLAVLTRFAGLAMVAASLVALVPFRAQSIPEKLKAAAIYVTPAVLPFAYWSLRNSALSDSATGRPIEWLLTRTRLALTLGQAANWIFTNFGTRRIRILLLAALVTLLILLAAYVARRVYQDRRLSAGARWLPAFLLTFIITYLGMMLASMAFLDATLRITHRYLSPALAVGMILAGLLAHWRLAQPGRIAGLKRVITGAFLVLLAIGGVNMLRHLAEPRPMGYVDTRNPSGTIELLLEVDPEVTIISNDRETVYILTGRTAYSVPIGRDQFTQELRADLSYQLQVYHDRLANGAVLVLFDDYWVRDFKPSGGTLIEGLFRLADAEDGALYVDPQAWPELQGESDAGIHSRG